MKKFSSVYLFSITFSFLLLSCEEETKPKNDSTTDNYIKTSDQGIKTDIGTTGFTINLPTTHKIEERKGADFTVYYITSIDTSVNKGGAGIYFGRTPDEHGPPSVVSKTETAGMTFGKNSKSTKFITPSYTWIETVIDEGDGNKIQIWHFAYNEIEMTNLGQMIGTIARK